MQPVVHPVILLWEGGDRGLPSGVKQGKKDRGGQGGSHRLPHSRCPQGEMSQRVSSCPCVENVEGSLLIPVHVEREVQLRGRNLWLFQVRLLSG